MSMADRPVQNAIIQGRKVSLDVMDMGMHIHMQAMKGNPVPDSYDNKQSRAIMVMIRSIKSKETLKNADVEIQIISPKGKIITGTAPWFGDHYGQSFSPTEKGVYRIIVKVAGKEAKGAADFKYKHEV